MSEGAVMLSISIDNIKTILRKEFNLNENDEFDIHYNCNNELIVNFYFKPVCQIDSITLNFVN